MFFLHLTINWNLALTLNLMHSWKNMLLSLQKDKTSIGTTPLTEMMIDTGTSDPVSQNPHPIAMKNYQWVKDKIEKLLTAKVIWSSRSSCSAPIRVVPRGDGGKQLVINYYALNTVTRNSIGPCLKEMIFSLNWIVQHIFQPWIYKLVNTIYLWINLLYLKWHSTHHLASMNMSRYLLDLHKFQHASRNSWQPFWKISTLQLLI